MADECMEVGGVLLECDPLADYTSSATVVRHIGYWSVHMISRQQWLFTKLVSGFIIAAAVAVIVLRMGYLMDRGSWLNTLTVLSGGVFGWTTGILFSPKTKTEDTKFPVFRASVATFVAGFVVAKIDQVYDAHFQNGVMSEQFLIGVLLFSTAFGIGLLFTFVGRLADDVFR